MKKRLQEQREALPGNRSRGKQSCLLVNSARSESMQPDKRPLPDKLFNLFLIESE